MADDARISTALPRHPKTVKLQRRLAAPGCWSLVCLFLWVAENRPEGNLEGMSGEDIEIAANWPGDTGAFVRTLPEVRFLDGQEGAYKIHDWAELNPWAASRPRRIEKARAAASVRWGSKQVASEPNATSMQSACDSHETAMPSSPLLTPPPHSTSNPPSLKESIFDLEEKTRAREASETPRSYCQKDFDERDLRKLCDARREVELKLNHGWGSGLTDEQIFEEQCAYAGITVQRALEVSERANRWPARTELGASV